MSRDVTVTITNSPANSGVQGDTGKWLIIGQTDRGPVDQPIVCRSMTEVVAATGNKVAYGFIYDACDTFFKRGGTLVVIGRCVGPAAAQAAHTFNDSSAQAALRVKAANPGAWGNNLTVQIAAGGSGAFVLTVRESGTVKKISPDLADVAAAIDWAEDNASDLIVIEDPGAVADPAVIAATALTGGADDRVHVNNASWQAAIDLFGEQIGIGQVSAPGITTSAVQQIVADHCVAHRRHPILDLVDLPDPDDVAATVAALTIDDEFPPAAYSPWAVVQGPTPTSTLTVPYSAVQAALHSVTDGDGPVPAVGTPAAGDQGVSGGIVLGLSQDWNDADADTLAAARINPVVINDSGQVQTDGNQTLADPDTAPAWVEVTAARTFMYAVSRFASTAARFRLKPNDRKGGLIAKFKGALTADIQALSDAGIVDNDPATGVDTGMNNDTTRTARQLLATAEVQPTASAWTVAVNVYAEAA